MGRGFVPMAQTARDNQILHPEPLAVFGDQFAAHGYDVRKAILWAAMSEPFQLAGGATSLATPANQTLADRGEWPLFNQYLGDSSSGSPLRARAVLQVALKGMGGAKLDATTTARVDSLPKSIAKKGAKKGKKLVAIPPAPQAIFVSGGAPVDPMAKVVLASSKLTAKQKAEHLFQMALHRPPRNRESALLDQVLKKAGDNPQDGLTTIWTAFSQASGLER
jgi:hypothetical protein